jgi:hypothetical protein
VTGWIIAIAFLLAPLGCWALLARTKVLGWTFAFVFAAYAVTEWFLSSGWPLGFRFDGERLWLVLGLPVLTVVALIVGTQLENRDLGVPRMRTTGRNTAGITLSMLYGVAVAGGVLLTLIAIKVGDGS